MLDREQRPFPARPPTAQRAQRIDTLANYGMDIGPNNRKVKNRPGRGPQDRRQRRRLALQRRTSPTPAPEWSGHPETEERRATGGTPPDRA